MGFTKQLTSSFADFISKLNTFLSSEGWTTHHVPANGEFAARKTPPAVTGNFDIAFALQWDTAIPGNAGIYQHLGAYNNGLQPFDQADDSGNGEQSTTPTQDSRFIALGPTPTEFWCFTDTSGTYFHVVVQTAVTDVQHFGAGALDLYGDGDITGGEYVYGQRVQFGFSIGSTLLGGATTLLDGLSVDGGTPNDMETFVATVHLEDFPGMVANQKWQVCMGGQGNANHGLDRASIFRGIMTGGFRAGPGVLNFGEFLGSTVGGLVPGYPVNVFYRETTASPHRTHGPVGRQLDVRGVNITNFVIGDTVTIGSDTWHLFPTFRKFISGSKLDTTGHQGIMYKEIT